nr:MAG TPA: hypothetical protein [Caudoviricetes sp.]
MSAASPLHVQRVFSSFEISVQCFASIAVS